MPKMFQGGVQGQKGQWQMEILEGGGRARPGTKVTLCTDNLLRQQQPGAAKDLAKKRAAECKHRLLKDTPDEAVMESVCKERTTTVSMKRDGKSTLMEVTTSGAERAPQTMKMRYTHLGPCREGQGTMSLDKDSEECRKIRAQAAKMDPATSCARAKTDREACEQRMRETVAQLSAMCN